jgi:hypothetical protein
MPVRPTRPPDGRLTLPAARPMMKVKEVVTMPQPEKTFRIGSCHASVFVNSPSKKSPDNDRSYRTVSLQRRYREGDRWKTSTSFTLSELPSAVAVLQVAMDYVASQEAEQ